MSCGLWTVPVVDHLRSQDCAEGKAGDEAVEDEFVVHLLQRGEDTGEGAHEVVEDLYPQYVSNISVNGAQARMKL